AQQAQSAAAATSTPATSPTQKTIEAYLRHLYAFGPNVALVVAPPKPSQVEGLLETNIDLTIDGNKQTVKFYVSKDGRFLFQGELSDMTKDPLAQNLAQIQMTDAPSMGDPSAAVTLVEYSDFECPVCRKLHDALREILPTYAGKVRVVLKDFPIEQLHPWARAASMAGAWSAPTRIYSSSTSTTNTPNKNPEQPLRRNKRGQEVGIGPADAWKPPFSIPIY